MMFTYIHCFNHLFSRTLNSFIWLSNSFIFPHMHVIPIAIHLLLLLLKDAYGRISYPICKHQSHASTTWYDLSFDHAESIMQAMKAKCVQANMPTPIPPNPPALVPPIVALILDDASSHVNIANPPHHFPIQNWEMWFLNIYIKTCTYFLFMSIFHIFIS